MELLFSLKFGCSAAGDFFSTRDQKLMAMLAGLILPAFLYFQEGASRRDQLSTVWALRSGASAAMPRKPSRRPGSADFSVARSAKPAAYELTQQRFSGHVRRNSDACVWPMGPRLRRRRFRCTHEASIHARGLRAQACASVERTPRASQGRPWGPYGPRWTPDTCLGAEGAGVESLLPRTRVLHPKPLNYEATYTR